LIKQLLIISLITSSCFGADLKMNVETDEFTGVTNKHCRYIEVDPRRQWTMYEILKFTKTNFSWGESNKYPERQNTENRKLNLLCEETGYKSELKETNFKSRASSRHFEESTFELTKKDQEEITKCLNLKIRYGYVVRELGNTKCLEELN
jgi:hypothetical protein